uniref:Putative secreted protein n=1 Tax=mine drainage metagenome TaxID=410659 RepID=E6QJ14_9ZZZZ
MAGLKLQKPLAVTCLLLCLGIDGELRRSSAQSSASPTLAGDQAHPAATHGWVDTRLYFELGPYEMPGMKRIQTARRKTVTDGEWMAFLDREATPRFPDGLSVQDVYGQWKGAHDVAPNRGRSKVLIIDYPETAANEARIDAIRAAWKQQTGEQSVLKVTVPAQVSF